ncbi:VRR-NUC domain containing protein [uncultured Caudovirales phage]|uniref:VRR-NUC domain containing protein n=1 Tax=uncultured Caudovirales phage TaxID=2100421 RepID=A0A6J5KL72_9CAUD|nr:VRR-NUC domain containing protein [uncultured Caudovirales phage]
MTKGTDLSNAVRLALSGAGHMVFRANVGKVRIADGRWFDTGLPKGFSDLFGHRGSDGRAFYIEIKAVGDRVTQDQAKFLEAMRQCGALSGVARSVDDALSIVS